MSPRAADSSPVGAVLVELKRQSEEAAGGGRRGMAPCYSPSSLTRTTKPRVLSCCQRLFPSSPKHVWWRWRWRRR
jgi:hypothetical protein